MLPQMERDRFQKLQDFFADALKDKKNPILSVARKLFHQMSGADRVNITGTYLVFSESSYKKIGKVYGVSDEWVRKVIEHVVIDTWNLSSKKTRDKYPLWDLCRSGYVLKLRGRSLKALNLLSEGKSPDEIKKDLNFTTRELGYARAVLRSRGVYIGALRKDGERLAQGIKNAKDDRELKSLLDSIDRRLFVSILRTNKDVITPVKRIIFDSGYYLSNRDLGPFLESMEKSGIPYGKMPRRVKRKQGERVLTYYFVASQHVGRIQEAFWTDPSLDRYKKNPIVYVTGPAPKPFPTTWDLQEHRGYFACGNILGKMGIRITRSSGWTMFDFFTPRCPVTILKWGGTYYYQEKDEMVLRNFFAKRMRELTSRS